MTIKEITDDSIKQTCEVCGQARYGNIDDLTVGISTENKRPRPKDVVLLGHPRRVLPCTKMAQGNNHRVVLANFLNYLSS